jgi:hypothetical protein
MTEDMTPSQAAFYAQGELAITVGVIAVGLIIFLLTVIAVRSLRS